MKKRALFVLSIMLLTTVIGCQSNEKKPVPKTEKVVIDGDDTVVDGISEMEPDNNVETVETMTLTNVAGKTSGIVIRFSMPPAITAEEVKSAYIRLKYKLGDEPHLKVSGITQKWMRLDSTWNLIHLSPLLDTENLSEKAENDYYSTDVTDIVKKWLDGSYENYGFLVTETKEKTSTEFFTPNNCSPEQYPELVVNYEKKVIPPVGNYVYKEQEAGNCLSFALRDITPILAENLGVDLAVVEDKYNHDGLDGVLNDINELTLGYIDKHKEGLKIESIRKIDHFDSQINEGEYRVAFRVGVLKLENKFYAYDFHFQVQLTDGSWGEKLGAGQSRIVPGSNIENDPSRYPWDASAFWDNPKTNGLYSSRTIFYAVKKSTLEYTEHTYKK